MKNVSFKYNINEDHCAIKNVNIEIKKGEFVAIVGHNGSGKSTIAKHLNAMILPTRGRVFVGGMDTHDEDKTYKIRCTVGVVLQNPDNQIVSIIVEDDVAFGPENLGIKPEEIRKRVDFALKSVGMYEMRKEFVSRLSGGQKQRVAIAGILAMNPDCIIFDESTSMLDPKGKNEVLKALLDLNKNQGMTVVLITHFMEEAVLADKIFIMKNGEIAANGNKRDIFSEFSLLESCNLSLPQPAKLISSLRKEGMDIPQNPLNKDECVDILDKFLSSKLRANEL
ncbi:MAG: energy-coupling factor transporter ATPase [Oscillospiraceae bacterium]|nr:energy-coupling factor transporter ATPase [Oscillospiraceae bacterium]